MEVDIQLRGNVVEVMVYVYRNNFHIPALHIHFLLTSTVEKKKFDHFFLNNGC